MHTKANKRQLPAALILILLFTASSHAQSYLAHSSGMVIKSAGSLAAGDEIKAILEVIKVLEPTESPTSHENWIGNEIRITIAESEKVFVKYYATRQDGIYCVSETTGTESTPKPLDAPYMILPAVIENGKTWDVNYTEDKKKLSLKCKIENSEEELKIGEKTFKTVHVKAEGSAKVMGLEIPLSRETWYAGDLGVIKQITTQKIGRTDAVVTITLTP
jgi:hypothetical protein